MKKSIIIICSCLLLVSCVTNKTVSKRDLVNVNSSLNKAFSNTASSHPDVTLTNLFEMNGMTNKQVTVSFDKEGDIKISYKDMLEGERFKCFKGKFKKRYYEIYLEKKRIPFPPIYWLTQVNRLRISLDKENNLLVDKYFNHSGMILMMSAGTSSKDQFIFKPIN